MYRPRLGTARFVARFCSVCFVATPLVGFWMRESPAWFAFYVAWVLVLWFFSHSLARQNERIALAEEQAKSYIYKAEWFNKN